MSTLVLSSLTTEYLHIPVTGDVDLDAQVVAIAVIPVGQEEPADDEWHEAAWVGAVGTTRSARVLIGPEEDLELANGTYTAWVKVTDTPEIPVRKSGLIRVT